VAETVRVLGASDPGLGQQRRHEHAQRSLAHASNIVTFQRGRVHDEVRRACEVRAEFLGVDLEDLRCSISEGNDVPVRELLPDSLNAFS
jgi:hypothetical protein